MRRPFRGEVAKAGWARVQASLQDAGFFFHLPGVVSFEFFRSLLNSCPSPGLYWTRVPIRCRLSDFENALERVRQRLAIRFTAQSLMPRLPHPSRVFCGRVGGR